MRLLHSIRADFRALYARIVEDYRERTPGESSEEAPEKTSTRAARAHGFSPSERVLAVTAAHWFEREYPAREGFENLVLYRFGSVEVTAWRERGVIHVAHESYFWRDGEEE